MQQRSAVRPSVLDPDARFPQGHGVDGAPERMLPDMQHDMMEFAEAQQFRFGASIQASDGRAGTLGVLVVDTQHRTITHIGIRASPFHRRFTFVTVNGVTHATADTLTLSIPLDQLAKHSPTAMPEGIALTPSTQLRAEGKHGKPLGHLVQVTIHRETCELRHLVVARRLRGKVLVLACTITGITARQVAVRLNDVVPNQRSRSDVDLQRDVYESLYNYAPLRVDLSGIEIHTREGTVALRGHVSSDGKRRLAEHLALGLVGVAGLRNELVADDELAAAVAMALARDPRTVGQHIGVYPQLGVTWLRGSVQTSTVRAAASDVATGVVGVKHVVNELRVNPHASTVPALASVTNREEMVPGGR